MENFNRKPRKRPMSISAIVSLIMAIVIICIGLAVFLGKYIGFSFAKNTRLDPLMLYVFGGLCLVYGGFRLYRSIKQDDYYNED